MQKKFLKMSTLHRNRTNELISVCFVLESNFYSITYTFIYKCIYCFVTNPY